MSSEQTIRDIQEAVARSAEAVRHVVRENEKTAPLWWRLYHWRLYRWAQR